MLAFLAIVPATRPATVETTEAPTLPTFASRWWYRPDRLDARPVAWSLRNRPEDWGWQHEGITIVRKPSEHVFWVANGPMFHGLYDANCSCNRTNGKFQSF